MKVYNLKVKNFSCEACEKVTAMTLKKIIGVTAVDVLSDGTVMMMANQPIDLGQALKNLENKGYKAEVI